MSIPFLDGFRALKYMAATGAGSEVDPFVIQHQNNALTDEQLRAAAVPVTVTLDSGTVTASLSRITTSGSIPSGAIEVSIAVIGGSSATVLGVVVPAGTAIQWRSPPGATLSSIAYDATGSEILVSEVR